MKMVQELRDAEKFPAPLSLLRVGYVQPLPSRSLKAPPQVLEGNAENRRPERKLLIRGLSVKQASYSEGGRPNPWAVCWSSQCKTREVQKCEPTVAAHRTIQNSAVIDHDRRVVFVGGRFRVIGNGDLTDAQKGQLTPAERGQSHE
jgi:hypothetical protein